MMFVRSLGQKPLKIFLIHCQNIIEALKICWLDTTRFQVCYIDPPRGSGRLGAMVRRMVGMVTMRPGRIDNDRQISTVLLEITVEVLWQWPTGLRVWPVSAPSGSVELPAYATTASAGVYQTLGYSFGWDAGTKVPNWCAAINDDTCLSGPSVATDSATWGGIKALYR